MEIIKFKKDKGNYYNVFFDDDIIVKLHDDVIVKYNLLINKVIDKNKFNEIMDYNDFLNGYYKSINYINKKMRSVIEVKNYLKKLDIKSNDIDKIIDLLKKDGYLNKRVYISAYINDKYKLSNNGPIKVKDELIKLGFIEEEFCDYLYSLDWSKKLKQLVYKRIKINHKLSNNALKNRILSDLIKLGFLKDDIIYVLDTVGYENDYNLLCKELSIIKMKYSKKYSGKELEYKVINYLYKKGFLLEDIKRCYNEN